MNEQKLKEIGNLGLLIPTVSHAGHALTTFSLRSRNVGRIIRWSTVCHWLVRDRVEKT